MGFKLFQYFICFYFVISQFKRPSFVTILSCFNAFYARKGKKRTIRTNPALPYRGSCRFLTRVLTVPSIFPTIKNISYRRTGC